MLATWEAEIRRIMAEGQPWQMVCETPSPKWSGDIVQVMECLLCKHEALSSNPSSTKKKSTKMTLECSSAVEQLPSRGKALSSISITKD
jgi:hypothetical protein